MGNDIELVEDDVPFEGGFSGGAITPAPRSDLADIETTRAQQEVQAGFLMAKQFPRDEQKAVERIIRSCQRKSLAEKAVYAFPRGGTQVTGPTIRLAEVLVQQWGNINFGYRELAESAGMTMVLAYAYDLETNARAEKTFHVKHVRDTKSGPKTLTDRRDIYELIANQASRRIRSCILQIIPGDVVEIAMEAAAVALEEAEGTNIKDRQAAIVKAFSQFEVTPEMIESKFGKKISALLPADIVVLRRIYQGLKDGMSRVEQWFDISPTEKAKEAVSKAAKKTKKKATKSAPKDVEEPKADEEPQEPEEPEEPPKEPESEPVQDEPEDEDDEKEEQEEEAPTEDDDSDDGVSGDEIVAAITVNKTRGRPSNFAIQLENHLVAAIEALMSTGLSDDDAASAAAAGIYAIMTDEPFNIEDINAIALNDRVEFLSRVKGWVEDLGE
jgi:hypothetical protein